jgi:hypothetical protein
VLKKAFRDHSNDKLGEKEKNIKKNKKMKRKFILNLAFTNRIFNATNEY